MFKLKTAFESIQSVWHGSHSSTFPSVADGVKYLPEQAVIMIHFPRGKSVVNPVDQILADHNIDISVQGLLKSYQGKDGSGSLEDRFNGNEANHLG